MQQPHRPTLHQWLRQLAQATNQQQARVVKIPAKTPELVLQANSRAAEVVERPDMFEPLEGGSYGEELRAMQDRSFCYSQKYQEQQTRVSPEGAHPDVVEFSRRFIKRMWKLGVPMWVHCYVRSEEAQATLYAQGLSLAKPTESPHQYGLAVDIIHGTKAWDLTRKQWALLYHIGMEVAAQMGLKLVCGYDWDGDGDLTDQRLFDPAHWQLANWRDIGTTWYKPLVIP